MATTQGAKRFRRVCFRGGILLVLAPILLLAAALAFVPDTVSPGLDMHAWEQLGSPPPTRQQTAFFVAVAVLFVSWCCALVLFAAGLLSRLLSSESKFGRWLFVLDQHGKRSGS